MLPTLALTALLATAPLPPAAQTDSTWRDHNRAADAATTRRDWSDARHHLRAVDNLLGGHPAVKTALARNALRAGDSAEALAQLRQLAAMGVVSNAAGDTTFAGLRGNPAFQAIVSALAGNAVPIGSARAWASLPDSAALAEDLAWDESGRRLLVSDVRGHRIWAVDERARATHFGDPQPPGWAVLGLGVDPARRALWATTVTMRQAEGFTPADSGRAAILHLDLATGRVVKRFDLPSPSLSAPGDLVVAPNGDVFLGDGQTGAVYAIRQAADSLTVLLPPGRLRGTQQPALSPDGRSLFIPDYGRGIARLDLATGGIHWLQRPDSVTLTGIDGLVWHERGLIAVQNGVNPNRIVRLDLSPAFDAVVRASIVLRDTARAGDLTHAQVVGSRLYVIGIAGWGKYNDDGTPRANAARIPPPILVVDLPAAASPR